MAIISSGIGSKSALISGTTRLPPPPQGH
jgi:hypothetical protein